jgi:hypothetical protein
VTVYVDDSGIPADVTDEQTGRTYRGRRWCHLTADTKAELHEFAARLGMQRRWFQDKDRGLWHYDIVWRRRADAIRLGAVAISWKEFEPYKRPGREGRPPLDPEVAAAKEAEFQEWLAAKLALVAAPEVAT